MTHAKKRGNIAAILQTDLILLQFLVLISLHVQGHIAEFQSLDFHMAMLSLEHRPTYAPGCTQGYMNSSMRAISVGKERDLCSGMWCLAGPWQTQHW